MRMLFSFAGGHGHFEPLAPIAAAAQRAGHDVSFACRLSAASAVAAAGFQVEPAGPDSEDLATVAPLLTLDPHREQRDFLDGFASRLARGRATALLALCRTQRPDMLVCDETDFGAMVAAEILDLPCASVLVLVAGSFSDPATLAPRLDELRKEFDLPADPGLRMLSRHLQLAPFPAILRDPRFPLHAQAQTIRPGVLDVLRERASDTASLSFIEDRSAPLVYLTLGTVFNMESGDLLQRALAGLSALPVRVVATVGRQLDPSTLGDQPANVHLASYLPQAAVLSRASLVVSHGGSGTVIGATSYGVPSVLLPMGADQPDNARRCAELGVAVVLDAVAATAADIGASAKLADRDARERAMAIRREAEALPDARVAVDRLEALVTR